MHLSGNFLFSYINKELPSKYIHYLLHATNLSGQQLQVLVMQAQFCLSLVTSKGVRAG
jgi:hypothetical protein